jgi:DNA-binding CsgD family transcriptional regulator
MKYEPITVQHVQIEPRNEGAIDEFERCLADACKEWMKRNKPTEEAFRQLCETLLGRLQQRAVALITPEAIAKIHDPATAREGAALVKSICGEISRFLRLDLICMSGLPLRGRRREFSARDRKIWEMRRTGLSYGRIGHLLDISRNAVQAVCRRERRRRDFLCRRYALFRELLSVCGIILQAKPAS